MDYRIPHLNRNRPQFLLGQLPSGLKERIYDALGCVDASDTLRLGGAHVLVRVDIRRVHRGYYLVRLSFIEQTSRLRRQQDMSDFLGPWSCLGEYPRQPPAGYTGQWPPPDEQRFHDLLDSLAESADEATGTKLTADGPRRPTEVQP